MAGTGTEMVDFERLRDTVITLTRTVSRLETEVTGLMASHDGGVYGEDYAADRGPAAGRSISRRPTTTIGVAWQNSAIW